MAFSSVRDCDRNRFDDGDGQDYALHQHGFSFASNVCYYSDRSVTCGDIL